MIIVAVAIIAAVLPGAAHASQLRSSDAARGLASPTRTPTTPQPTKKPTPLPTRKPTQPTKAPTPKPSAKPTTSRPTKPTTSQLTARPTTARPTIPTLRPTGQRVEPRSTTAAPTTDAPTTAAPTTAAPTTAGPRRRAPRRRAPAQLKRRAIGGPCAGEQRGNESTKHMASSISVLCLCALTALGSACRDGSATSEEIVGARESRC
jgi:hypothetical protein